MSGLFQSLFGFFLTWWGAFLMGALDSSMLFFLPFGIDALVIYLAARDEQWFWLYPLLATAGSVTGAAVTFWIGRKGGEYGLERMVSGKRLERIRVRIRNSSAVAMAVPALMPPPFPLTPFVLACGALDVNRWTFFVTLAAARLVRFGAEGVLAHLYGNQVLRVLRSDAFQLVVGGFALLAIAGTIVSAVKLWRDSRSPRRQPA